jgi:hypothetical protein
VTVSTLLELPTVTALADRADGQVFGPSEPSAQDVDAFWREVDSVVVGMGADAGFWKRVKARLNVRSLTGSGRVATRFPELKDAAAARVRREPGNIERKASVAHSGAAVPDVGPESETR